MDPAKSNRAAPLEGAGGVTRSFLHRQVDIGAGSDFLQSSIGSSYLSDSGAHSPCADDPDHCIRWDRLVGRELGSRECCEHAGY